MITVATSTWNSIDLIESFLVHYERLGVSRIYVMDFASGDDTRSVLTSGRWTHLVHMVDFPGVEGLDSSNIMLSIIREQVPAHGSWCLFCDPDEFLVTPGMRPLRDMIEAEPDVVIAIPRFNMTAPLSACAVDGLEKFSFDDFTLRIDRTTTRTPAADIDAANLDPPWIFSAIPGKVLFRTDLAAAVGAGDHSVTMLQKIAPSRREGVYLLHYPIRTYAAFESKITMAAIDFAANPGHSQSYGWHARRWVNLARQGKLRSEYLQQMIPDAEVERLVAERVLAIEYSVKNFHE